MSVLQQPSPLAPVVPPPAPSVAPLPVSGEEFYRLSVAQYHEMIQVGILTPEDRVELLEGYLVVKMPKKRAHSLTTRSTRLALERIVPLNYYVDSQEPVTTDTSEPEPDVTVIRGKPEQFQERHPGPQDVALLVEVSDSSLQRDRGSKKQLYAWVRIPIYWIINLIDKQIEVYTEPSGPAEHPDYGKCQDYGLTDEIPVLIEGREVGRVAVKDIMV